MTYEYDDDVLRMQNIFILKLFFVMKKKKFLSSERDVKIYFDE